MAAHNKKIKLSNEIRSDLENMDTQFQEVERSLNSLRSMGMDVTAIERQLKTARKQREILLRDF